MTLRLAAWGRADREIEFDLDTGAGRVIKLPVERADDAPVCGLGHRERRLSGASQFFAVYRAGEDIYFHAGALRWRLGTPGLQFEHRHPFPFVASFRVSSTDSRGFACSYVHFLRQFLAFMDPTYDAMDEETDFFLVFVVQNASSPEWIEHVRTRWTSAT